MRVMLAEDAVLLREGVVHLLTDAGFEVAAAVGDAQALLKAVEADPPDVVVVDIRMPPTHTDEGLRAAFDIRVRWPDVGVLVLSQYVEVPLATRLLSIGSHGLGYLLKDRITNVEEFADAVRRVGSDGSSLDPTVVAELLTRSEAADGVDRLTAREREVLGLMAEGLTNAAIADRAVISVRAVEKHVTNIFDKLDLPPTDESHRRVVAVLRYLGVE